MKMAFDGFIYCIEFEGIISLYASSQLLRINNSRIVWISK